MKPFVFVFSMLILAFALVSCSNETSQQATATTADPVATPWPRRRARRSRIAEMTRLAP